MTDTELETRETFLRAIFDSPDDPTPRLIYADWLEERGDETAGAMRTFHPSFVTNISLIPGVPLDLASFRRKSVVSHWDWFGAAEVELFRVQILDDIFFDTLDAAPATKCVTSFVANGMNTDIEGFPTDFSLDQDIKPLISNAAVELLARHRFSRRLNRLDLRYNDLGNDAARAIARSPFLDNLKSLKLSPGNRIRGRVWQDVVARFGEEVVE